MAAVLVMAVEVLEGLMELGAQSVLFGPAQPVASHQQIQVIFN
jgi:hypothetical protein